MLFVDVLSESGYRANVTTTSVVLGSAVKSVGNALIV
jgi:hypothetical protein